VDSVVWTSVSDSSMEAYLPSVADPICCGPSSTLWRVFLLCAGGLLPLECDWLEHRYGPLYSLHSITDTRLGVRGGEFLKTGHLWIELSIGLNDVL